MKYRSLTILIALISGILIGWMLFHHKSDEAISKESKAESNTIWTCSMHPEIRQTEPGQCPICGMDLIPAGGSGTGSGIDPEAIRLSDDAAILAKVTTSIVTRQAAVKEIRLYGKIQADERVFQTIVAQVTGRIEKLTANFTGESVVKGQELAQIYSPELINAEKELLETVKTKATQPELYEAAKQKLRQWKLSENQINEIEKSGHTLSTYTILSGTTGTIISRNVNNGDYVAQGSVLYEISDLSKVWVLFDAYESDLQFMKNGQEVEFAVQSFPDEKFHGKVVFIDPLVDPSTRTAKIRVETSNASGKLKPGMFVTGIASSSIKSFNNSIVIPKSDVLWTGKRSIVYVKKAGTDEYVFNLREVTLGQSIGDGYIITDGLTEGEEIVTNGTFSVDAAAQLGGKPSMMNRSQKSEVGRPKLHDDSSK
jgi:membrane fusion protein, copper/silver efflux system